MTAKMMSSFDELPSDVRRMLTELDFNWNADDALVLHNMGWDAERIRRKLIDMELAKHRRDAEDGALPLQK